MNNKQGVVMGTDIFDYISEKCEDLIPDNCDYEKYKLRMLVVHEILQNDRFYDRYRNLSIIIDNESIALSIYYNGQKIIVDSMVYFNNDENRVFINHQDYHNLAKLENIAFYSKDNQEYSISFFEETLRNEEFLQSIIKCQKFICNENLTLSHIIPDFAYNKILVSSSVNVDKIRSDFEFKKIFNIEKEKQKYKNDLKVLLNMVKKDYPELFKSKEQIVEGASYVLFSSSDVKFENLPVMEYNHADNYKLITTRSDIEKNTPLSFRGLKYLSIATSQSSHGKNNLTDLLALVAEDNDIIGFISYSGNNKSHIKTIDFSSTNFIYRKMGVISSLYKKMSTLGENLQYLFVNNFYTDDGKKYISHIKEKLSKENGGFFNIDLDYSNESYNNNKNVFICDFNYKVYKIICGYEEDFTDKHRLFFTPDTFKKVRTVYDLSINEIDKLDDNIFNSYNSNKTKLKSVISDFQNRLKKEIGMENKEKKLTL